MSWPHNTLDRGFSVQCSSFKAKYRKSKRKPILRRHTKYKGCKSAGSQEGSSRVEESNATAVEDSIEELDVVPVDEGDDVPVNEGEPVPRFQINLQNCYQEALWDKNGMSVLGMMAKVIILQDFNIKTRKLKHNSHVVVTRRVLNFLDGCKWVYACSCNKSCSQFMSTLKDDINQTHSDFNKLQSECIHLVIAVPYVTKLDIMSNISPEDALRDICYDDHTYADCLSQELDIHKLQDQCLCYFDETTRTYGVIMILNKAFWCSVCHSSSCPHVRFISRYKETPHHELPDELHDIFNEFRNVYNQSAYKIPVSISKLKIPFRRSRTMASKFSGLHDTMLLDSVFQPTPHCNKCSSEIGEFKTVSNRCPVLASHNIYYIMVNSWKCHMCSETYQYDGLADGLLNMGTYVVTHEIMRNYLHGFLHGKRTLFAFYTNLKEVHLDYGHDEFHNLFPYNKIKNAWYSYLNLLDIDYTDGFCCNKCGTNPEIIICDGTSLSFRKQMLNVVMKPIELDGELLHGSSFKEIVIVEAIHTRKLLRSYSKGKPITSEEFTDMVTSLEDKTPEIANFLNEIDQGNHVAPSGYRAIIASLGSDSPVSVLIPNDETLHDAFQQLINGLVDVRTDPCLWKSVQEGSPIIFEILSKDGGLHPLPNFMKELLTLLVKKAQQPFDDKICHADTVVSREAEISCFPALQPLRNRGRYSSDKAVTERKERCRKDFKGHPSLLPGIFTIFCNHGVCYGYQVMQNHESANIPFTIFRTRFFKAPNIIVYDFACSLHKYCLRRDPVFFKHTKFFVDRFHWHNHKACSHGYNMDLYPQYASLNTQINEQANSGLKRIKDQLSYMTQEHFMSHCRLFLYNKNINKQNS